MLSATAVQPNSVAATVTEIVYGGAVVTCRVKSDIGELETCQIAGNGAPVAVGAAVQVGWDPAAGALLAG